MSICTVLFIFITFTQVILANTDNFLEDGTDLLHLEQEDCERVAAVPTSEEFFMQYMLNSKPVIFTGLMEDESWQNAMRQWSNEYLKEHFGNVRVKVSISPTNEFEYVESISHWPNAERFWRSFLHLKSSDKLPNEIFTKLPRPNQQFKYSPCSTLDNECVRLTVDKVLVRPATTTYTLKSFLDNFSSKQSNNATYYVQYESIPKELESQLVSPPFASFLPHDLTGLWLGLGPTKANLHYDPNENLMFLISGSKKWTLYEPEQSTFLYEGFCKEGKMALIEENPAAGLHHTLERSFEDDGDISFFNSPVSIDVPDYARFPLLHNAKPKVCTVHAGEGLCSKELTDLVVLYLPPFWWHQVESIPDSEGRTLGVNFWYAPFFSKPVPCPTCKMEINRDNFPVNPF